jgi:hypothetical protein
MNTEVKQFTPVYHIEYGKGKVVSLTVRSKDELAMCYFPKGKCHEWVLLSALKTDTDTHISLHPITKEKKRPQADDPLSQVLSSILGE